MTTSDNDDINQKISNKKPYLALFRILGHKNVEIVSDAITAIYNILMYGSNTTHYYDEHPDFNTIQSFNGFNQLYALFKLNLDKYNTDTAAVCIAKFCRANEIPNNEIKKEIINHLKQLVNDQDDSTRKSSKSALFGLIQNQANKVEIQKEGFAIPE
ncbi:MAG: hypothetical protein EZS28_026826 [Streblomastix strix]|uniref:Uncharacterized protein n=1 Tax=Streblomastix strix TaxID=222440 RepID=A0A5J4V4X0_9EUKA|nr:MAG: hypothetical protein EZS28_026826 [Streblomastix strix]